MKYYSRRIDTKLNRDRVQVKVSTYRSGDNEFVSQITWDLPLDTISTIGVNVVRNDKIKEAEVNEEEESDEQDSDGE